MNLKRLLAGILACCIVGGALPSVGETADNAVLTASAADGEDYTEGTYESLSYRNYGDYIEIKNCNKSATSVVIPAEIDGVPVTVIGYLAFSSCRNLTSVTIPNSVTIIYESAFSHCIELTEITIPNSVTSIGVWAFSGCTGLSKISIPDSVTSINAMAFSECEALTEITIPDSVTSIGSNAFNSTPWLESKRKENPLVIVNGILIDGTTCSGDVVIPSNVTCIGDGVFERCTELTSITIPNSVTDIGQEAFFGCTGFTQITIPESVARINNNAFANCDDLTALTILNPNCVIEYFDYLDLSISDTVVIHGYENSTAQDYAIKHNYQFVSLGAAPEKSAETGDIDGDGKIDSSDASIALSEYSLLSTGKEGNFSESQKKLADLNKDGKIDSSDASLILAYYSYAATSGTDSIDVFLEKQGY